MRFPKHPREPAENGSIGVAVESNVSLVIHLSGANIRKSISGCENALLRTDLARIAWSVSGE